MSDLAKNRSIVLYIKTKVQSLFKQQVEKRGALTLSGALYKNVN